MTGLVCSPKPPGNEIGQSGSASSKVPEIQRKRDRVEMLAQPTGQAKQQMDIASASRQPTDAAAVSMQQNTIAMNNRPRPKRENPGGGGAVLFGQCRDQAGGSRR